MNTSTEELTAQSVQPTEAHSTQTVNSVVCIENQRCCCCDGKVSENSKPMMPVFKVHSHTGTLVAACLTGLFVVILAQDSPSQIAEFWRQSKEPFTPRAIEQWWAMAGGLVAGIGLPLLFGSILGLSLARMAKRELARRLPNPCLWQRFKEDIQHLTTTTKVQGWYPERIHALFPIGNWIRPIDFRKSLAVASALTVVRRARGQNRIESSGNSIGPQASDEKSTTDTEIIEQRRKQYVRLVRRYFLSRLVGSAFPLLLSSLAAFLFSLLARLPVNTGLPRNSFALFYAKVAMPTLALLLFLMALSVIAGVLCCMGITVLTRRSPTDLDDVFGGTAQLLTTLGVSVWLWTRYRPKFLSSQLFPLIRNTRLALTQAVKSERAIFVMFVLSIVYFLIVLVNRVVVVLVTRIAASTEQNYDDAFVFLVRCYATFVITAIGGGVLLNMVNDGRLLVPYGLVAALVGGVISLGIQDTLSNFVSGLMLSIDRPFQVSERIRINGGPVCQVQAVGVRAATLLNIEDDTEVTVPNRQLVQSSIANLAKPNPTLRVEVVVQVPRRELDVHSAQLLFIGHTTVGIDLPIDKDLDERLTELQRLGPLSPALTTYQEVVRTACSANLHDRKLDACDCSSMEWTLTRSAQRYQTVLEVNNWLSDQRRDSDKSASMLHFRRDSPIAQLEQLVSTEPSIESAFELTSDGDEKAVLRLRVYAKDYRQREEVLHEINRKYVVWLCLRDAETFAPIGGRRE